MNAKGMTGDQLILLGYSTASGGCVKIASDIELVEAGYGMVAARLTNADRNVVGAFLLEGLTHVQRQAAEREANFAKLAAAPVGGRVAEPARRVEEPKNIKAVLATARTGGVLEARVKEMSGKDALAACKKHGLSVSEDAPNGGVLAMRCKNALYAAIRRGLSEL
jgi:hypothetical protein